MTDPQITTPMTAATVWLNGTDEEKSAMHASLVAHEHSAPCRQPYDARTEERMAHVANGGTVRALPTDPAVRGGRRERRDGDWVSRDGQTWAYEPYSGEAS